MGYIDFHTHILPDMDDGAGNLEISYSMLKKMADEGVDVLFATPHCLLSREEEKSFIKRRRASFESLKSYLAEKDCDFNMPDIRLGAEIRVTREMKPFENVDELALEGTDLLLFELPFGEYSAAYGENIYNFSLKAKKIPVLAHIERYISIYSESDYNDLFSIPNAICQITTDFISDKKAAKFTAMLIRDEFPLVFGSDCHNMKSRPPFMASAFEKNKKFCSKYKILEYTMEGLFEFQNRLI